MLRHRLFVACLLCLLVALVLDAKEPPAQVIVWPGSGAPVVRFSLGKFKGIGGSGSQHNYSIDTSVENLWGKKIPTAEFLLYLFDKNKVRIGEGFISLSNVDPGQVVKFETTVSTSGTPVSVTLTPRFLPEELQSYLPAKTISITVNSVPQGAELKLDGKEAGSTPKMVKVGPGKHMLEFTRQGFNPGKYPFEVGPNDVSGGNINYELGMSSRDTVELRDGSILNGDLESVSATEVIVFIGGNAQHLNRNQVKRILLVERDTPPQ
jgi:hypothetical protein